MWTLKWNQISVEVTKIQAMTVQIMEVQLYKEYYSNNHTFSCQWNNLLTHFSISGLPIYSCHKHTHKLNV